MCPPLGLATVASPDIVAIGDVPTGASRPHQEHRERSMAKSRQLETAILMYKDLVAREASTIEEMRTNIAAAASQFNQVAEDVRCEPVNVGGVSAEWIAAPNAATDRVLLYLHGGGYVMCSVSTHRDLIARLARAAGVIALGLDYRLAPEHPFPASVDETTSTYRWLISSRRVDPKCVIVVDDSAGGGLTLAMLVALRDAGDPLPAAAICLSPWADLEATGESMTVRADADPFMNREALHFMAQLYLGDTDPRTPLAAPLYADLHGLPPLLIQVGSSETLLDDSSRIATRAESSGVHVSLEIWEDMIHGWHIFAPFLPEGQPAIERIGTFIRSHIR